MGGSNNGGSFPSFRNENFDCKDFSALVSLNSPNEEVLEKIGEDFILEIGIDKETGSVVAFYGSEIVGAVTVPQIAKFIDCLNKGNKYKGRVLSLRGGQCTIQISVYENA